MHAPSLQASICVQASSSSQPAPSGFFANVHCPVVASQAPTSWQARGAAQALGAPAAQLPAWQVSASVQGLPSSHAVPLAFGANVHCPVAASHVPACMQADGAGQATWLPPVQAPLLQASLCVQGLPSSQLVSSGALAYAHWPVMALQTPA